MLLQERKIFEIKQGWTDSKEFLIGYLLRFAITNYFTTVKILSY